VLGYAVATVASFSADSWIVYSSSDESATVDVETDRQGEVHRGKQLLWIAF
jgi:hypothetical protein